MIYKIPKRLLESKEEILRGFSSKPATKYDASAWRKHFKGDSNFGQISKEFPNPLRRSDIEGLSHEVRNGGYRQIRKLFLASMIWGYVKDDLRGAWRTNQMLSHAGAQEMLEKAARWISNGQIVEACKVFKLPWCGSAFSTKFFYFIGLGAQTSPVPCILDSNVAQSLEHLGKEEEWNLPPFNDVYGKGIRRCPEGYIQYIQSLDKWAKELGCRADYIEYFLYSVATGSGKRRKSHEGESMKKFLTLEDCAAFAKNKGYNVADIASAKKPPGWTNDNFRFARIGEYLKVFKSKGSWPEFYRGYCQNVREKAITRDMELAAKLFDSGLPRVDTPPEEEAVIQVRLPTGELKKLEEKAKKFDVDHSTLARIWILERLG